MFGPNPAVCAVMHLRQGLILSHMTVNRTGMVNMFTGGGTELNHIRFSDNPLINIHMFVCPSENSFIYIIFTSSPEQLVEFKLNLPNFAYKNQYVESFQIC